ncbi:hypothetical protein KVR01_013709 [Diaporthe batatas]|uniref:uncharacterized protein n=1 Tax=Diaporthe batatas TaxID=748121 RepID=UPI001D0399F9|nr:uncharacterized protein KVR01_013709 [Diaporthe batatas]KAG8156475.1 hypothetical protein KVR01_013709 [Diaporthe batatas]
MSCSPSSDAMEHPFLQMPLHLLTLILSELDDMQSLGSAIRSHRLLYAAYRDDTNTVLKSILRNQIPPGLMRYAVVAHDARHIDRDDKEALDQLLVETLGRRDRRGLTFHQRFLKYRIENNAAAPALAAALSSTHSVVQHFSRRFLADTLPLAPEVFGPARSRSAEASADEIFRACRALYRFEIYCNVGFRDDDNGEPGGDLSQGWSSVRKGCQEYTHFRAFSPWVNEQLACMHDYLERVLSRVFDEIAAHDVEWGAKSVDWLSRGKENMHKQAYLSYGLHFLFRVDRAEGYEQRLQLLKSKGLPHTSSFLAAHLHRAPPQDVCRCCPPGKYLLGDRRWTRQEIESELRARDTDGPDDLDSGPFDIWWYVHKHSFVQESVFQGENSLLRHYGYVMWDVPRTFDRGEVRSRVRAARRQAVADHDEVEKGRGQMERSWRERAAVYEDGGRGYWSEADLSRINWA